MKIEKEIEKGIEDRWKIVARKSLEALWLVCHAGIYLDHVATKPWD